MKLPKRVGEPQTVWQGPVPSKAVVRQDFRFPDGVIRDFYLWLGGKPVIVLPFTTFGVILTKQWRPGSEEAVLEAPGGHPKPGGQSPEEAVADELREETGFESQTVVHVGSFLLDPPSNQVLVDCYIALDCVSVGPPKPEKSELIEKKIVGFQEFLGLCWKEGATTVDAKTLSLLFLALPHLPQNLRWEFVNAIEARAKGIE